MIYAAADVGIIILLRNMSGNFTLQGMIDQAGPKTPYQRSQIPIVMAALNKAFTYTQQGCLESWADGKAFPELRGVPDAITGDGSTPGAR